MSCCDKHNASKTRRNKTKQQQQKGLHIVLLHGVSYSDNSDILSKWDK